MTTLMFTCAIALSAIAAFYSIVGLVAIFAAAPIPIIIMGSMLEVSKLVVASWIYRYWKSVPVLLKLYFSIALLILMMLTSMGIYGFLSKAHIEHAATSGTSQLTINEIDRQITVEKALINDANKVIGQLDKAVEVLANAERIRGPDGALAIREKQHKERKTYNEIITKSNQTIIELEQQKEPLLKQQLSLETEVGPIKYIAALIYDEVDQTILEKAIRTVILLIVVVFDPLAVLLLVAANWTVLNKNMIELKTKREQPVSKKQISAGPEQSISNLDNEETNKIDDELIMNISDNEEDFWRSRPKQ